MIRTTLLVCLSTEERCEPSLPLLRNTGSGRFCPEIKLWKALDKYEIGNGYETQKPSPYEIRHELNVIQIPDQE